MLRRSLFFFFINVCRTYIKLCKRHRPKRHTEPNKKHRTTKKSIASHRLPGDGRPRCAVWWCTWSRRRPSSAPPPSARPSRPACPWASWRATRWRAWRTARCRTTWGGTWARGRPRSTPRWSWTRSWLGRSGPATAFRLVLAPGRISGTFLPLHCLFFRKRQFSQVLGNKSFLWNLYSFFKVWPFFLLSINQID